MPDQNSGWMDFGMQAAQDIVGSGLGLILGGINDRRQIEQQKKLMGLQIMGQKQMTDYQMKKQLEMWDKTNFSAQVAQLHKAGLNPALLYGKGGPGGATAAVTPGSVTGAHAPTGGGEAMGMGLSMANMGLLRAQKENIEADTANKKAQATKTSGVDTSLGETQIQSLLQGIDNAKAQKKLTDLHTEIGNVQLDFDKGTLENRMSTVNLLLSKLIEETKIMENERLISDATINTKIGLLRQELALKITETWKTSEEAKLANEHQRVAVNNVAMAIQKNMQEWDKIDQEQQRIRLEGTRQRGTYDDMPQGLKAIMDNILIIPGLRGKGSTTPISGFHDRKR